MLRLRSETYSPRRPGLPGGHQAALVAAVVAVLASGLVVAGFATAAPHQATLTPVGQPADPARPVSTGVPRAQHNGLVAARHTECAVGDVLMRYLQTGNNQGRPWLDQRFAAYVGVSAPQARALADNYSESCDRVLDDRSAAAAASSAARATSAARASSAARERAAASQRAAAIDAYQDRSCAAIGGRRVGTAASPPSSGIRAAWPDRRACHQPGSRCRSCSTAPAPSQPTPTAPPVDSTRAASAEPEEPQQLSTAKDPPAPTRTPTGAHRPGTQHQRHTKRKIGTGSSGRALRRW